MEINKSMMSLEILNSVPFPSHYNIAATRELARKSIVPILSRSHQFVLVLSRPIMLIKCRSRLLLRNGVDKIVYGPDWLSTPPNCKPDFQNGLSLMLLLLTIASINLMLF